MTKRQQEGIQLTTQEYVKLQTDGIQKEVNSIKDTIASNQTENRGNFEKLNGKLEHVLAEVKKNTTELVASNITSEKKDREDADKAIIRRFALTEKLVLGFAALILIAFASYLIYQVIPKV